MTETKRVPREPTQEMVNAIGTLQTDESRRVTWRAMYDAAPDVPSEADTLLRELVSAVRESADPEKWKTLLRRLDAYLARKQP